MFSKTLISKKELFYVLRSMEEICNIFWGDVKTPLISKSPHKISKTFLFLSIAFLQHK